MKVPEDIVEHCNKHRLCVGCPMGTCAAPVSDWKFEEWLRIRIVQIREVIKPQQGKGEE